jgi:hypothetical protein
VNRTFVYLGQSRRITDILQPQRNVLVALGFALQAAFGTTTAVDGLACTQTTAPSMSVVVGPGSIIQSSVVDVNAYGSLAADTSDASGDVFLHQVLLRQSPAQMMLRSRPHARAANQSRPRAR